MPFKSHIRKLGVSFEEPINKIIDIDEFDIKLFSRENYRPSLTPEGRRFYQRVQEVLLQTKKLEALGKEMGMGQESEISIAQDSLCPMPAKYRRIRLLADLSF